MDAKLNHSDLSALLAKETGISLAKADLLTKALFDLIIEGLEQDGIVKINGLGTFKLTEVASRSSVNVNTGEKFEIKGHKKLVFTPADALKDAVNQPFAMFEPVEVDDTYSDDAEEENNEAETEENDSVEDTQMETEGVAIEDKQQTTEEPVVEDVVVADTVAPANEKTEGEAVEQKSEAVVLPQEENIEPEEEKAAEQPAAPTEESIVEQPKRPEPVMVHVPKKEKKQFVVPEKKKKNRTWVYVLFSVLSVFVAAVIFIMLYITPAENNSEIRVTETTHSSDATPVTIIEHKTDAVTGATVDATSGATPVTKTEHKTDAITGATVDAISGATPQDKELVSNEEPLDMLVKEVNEPEEYRFVITEELASLDLKNITQADTTLYDITGVWVEHKVVAHETLTRIALKYYGDKKLWPYIVKYNSLARPDDLSKGMKIVIPKLKPRN